MLYEIVTLTGFISVSGLFGSMIFFSFIVAPLIFRKLETKTAAFFIRSIFPLYYSVVILLAFTAAMCLFFKYPIVTIIMGSIGSLAVFARQYLMPRINKHRDQMLHGHLNAERAFSRMHFFSVLINAVQLVMTFVTQIYLGLIILN